MMFSIIDDMDRRERDYSIDFVKGVAILFVILLHNMPNESIYSIAYIGQAVPLFLLVSSYLTYGGFQRKGFNGYFSARNVKKMLDRVSLPFFLLIFSSGHNVQRLIVPYSVVSSAPLDILSKSRYFVVSPSTSPQSKASSTSVSGVTFMRCRCFT